MSKAVSTPRPLTTEQGRLMPRAALCSRRRGISASFLTEDFLLSVISVSPGQNQGKPTPQSLSKFGVFKMDHRARRHGKETPREEVSNSHASSQGLRTSQPPRSQQLLTLLTHWSPCRGCWAAGVAAYQAEPTRAPRTALL